VSACSNAEAARNYGINGSRVSRPDATALGCSYSSKNFTKRRLTMGAAASDVDDLRDLGVTLCGHAARPS
jgi:hypothetical protein